MSISKYIYSIELNLKDLVNIFAFSSDLALDPEIVEDHDNERSQKLYLWYDVYFFGDTPYLRPSLALETTVKWVQRRNEYLTYVSDKLLGIGGGFEVGRTVREKIELDPGNYVAYLDTRMRRLLRTHPNYSEVLKVENWFTLLAALCGLHRWGFSWRRIIASTLALYRALRSLNRGDVELLADSFMEYIFNRAVYGAIVDERYMAIEARQKVLKLIEKAKGVVEEVRRLVKNSKMGEALRILSNSFEDMRKTIFADLMNDISILADVAKGIESSERVKDIVFLGVYIEFINAIEDIINELEKVQGGRRARVVIGATETWSPLNLYITINRLAETVNRDVKVTIFYTPQLIPQILFSTKIVDDIRKDAKKQKAIENSQQETKICVEYRYDEHSIEIEFCPIIGKDAETIYHTLRSVIDINNEVPVYSPKIVGIAPMLSAIIRIELEKEMQYRQHISSYR
ncbi:hypothetical protein Igag_0610 [Ignisphaera aggregans DSM 17230]|uniref:Uncharacterized protein n=1 Tax=Ignisphaera aggregans (strain DSM 17230 / JCM 13409 / AQ1.S1) TaxID=583356 RepID=E0SSH2_IGNAA|nr:hypothetical protein Igag_0610 [Ignisphaera aggregans DSM 17230]